MTDRTGEFSPLSCDNNYRCNVARDFVPGCFNRYIFVLAEVDARVARAEEVVLHPFVPRHRYGPVVLVATVPVVVPTSSSAAATTTAAASASFAAVLVPTAASVARLLRFLPAIITGQVTLPFLKAATAAAATAGATASTPIIVSFERLAILVASIPAQKKFKPSIFVRRSQQEVKEIFGRAEQQFRPKMRKQTLKHSINIIQAYNVIYEGIAQQMAAFC